MAAKSQNLLREDLGGRFRLWKMLAKVGEPRPKIMPIWICRELFWEAHHLNRSCSRFESGVDCSVEKIDQGDKWIRKLMKKLFKSREPSLEESKEKARKLKDLIRDKSIHDYMYLWWNETVGLCDNIQKKKGPFLRNLLADSIEDFQVWLMCKAIAAVGTISPAPNLISPGPTEEDFEHFPCAIRDCKQCADSHFLSK